MSESKSSTCASALVGCCRFFLFAVFALAIVLTLVFTPSNPIFKASYEGQLRVIRDYVSEGGSINAVDKWNNTALHWAAKGNQYAVLKFLVDNGVEDTIISYLVMNHATLDKPNVQGETPLHLAILLNAYKSALSLLHLGANPNAVALNGNTPLHYLPNGCADSDLLRYR
ncbi:hypothetical protein BLSTO_00208 [Blastocystis sp. subtype 1]